MGYILLAVLIIAALYLITIYNNLVIRKNRIENGFAQIQVQLKRRYDLIPTLAQTVKGYMKYEQETLEAVIKARNEASVALSHVKEVINHAKDIKVLSNKEQELVNKLGGVQMLMEDYPELKANESVSQLMEELGTTENRIVFARSTVSMHTDSLSPKTLSPEALDSMRMLHCLSSRIPSRYSKSLILHYKERQ
jgi:LemA protein